MNRPVLSLTLLIAVGVSAQAQPQTEPKLVYPIIADHGGVVPLPKAAEPPRKGAKVVYDNTADAKPDDKNKGLERVARLLNLYGAAGLKASDVKIAVVLHGEATKAAPTDLSSRVPTTADRDRRGS